MADVTYANIPERAKRRLGWPTVEVYTDDETISQFVDDGFDLLASTVSQNAKMALPCKDIIQLPKEEVAIVTNVEPYGTRGSKGLIYVRDDFSIAEAVEYFNLQVQSLLTPILATMNFNQMRSAFGSIFHWHYDRHDGKLYCENVPREALCLAASVKITHTKETLKREHRTWLFDYTLANLKITEGRIRSKFEGSGASTTDGATMLTEGIAEQEILKGQLQNFIALDYGQRR
jgi:hypothetical protein